MAFMLPVGNGAQLWGLRDIQTWNALSVLRPLVFVRVLNAFGDLVKPGEPKDGQLL